LIYIKDKE